MSDTQKKAEIALCPFCGDWGAEVAESAVPSIHGGQMQAVYCNTCFCEGPTAETETGAVEAWNRRIAPVPAEGYVHDKAVLQAATQIRRLASAASAGARNAYIRAAEAVEMAVSAARPAVSGG